MLSARSEEAAPVNARVVFDSHLRRVRAAVEAYLEEDLSHREELGSYDGPAMGEVVRAVKELTLRGGKRLRAALLCAAYEGCGGRGGIEAVVGPAAALELLQSHFLIHDDWIDDDRERRGGPSVHVALRARFGSPMPGDALAILAGDLALAWSQELFLSAALPAPRRLEATRAFATMTARVLTGQVLDVYGTRDRRELERMYHLKTGCYTTGGPLELGAHLAGAPTGVREGLAAFAAPLGIAFQLRDDLLGAFGDPAETGKPAGGDIRQGKRTSVVLEGEEQPAIIPLLRRVLGQPEASPAEVAMLLERLEEAGIKGRLEARIDSLCTLALDRLEAVPLEPASRVVLAGAVDAIGHRRA